MDLSPSYQAASLYTHTHGRPKNSQPFFALGSRSEARIIIVVTERVCVCVGVGQLARADRAEVGIGNEVS